MIALDLFCGAGGAALGLMEAGYDVVGVDVDARCAAVYPGTFVRADWRDGLALLEGAADWDLVWASPPCERWAAPTALTRTKAGEHRPSTKPDLVSDVRGALARIPCRSVIENVPKAPIRCDLALSGPMAGLPRLYRIRHFELDGGPWPRLPRRTVRPAGSVAAGTLVSVTTQGGIPCRRTRRKRAAHRPDLVSSRFTKREMAEAMGLAPDTAWTTRQIGGAVPPAYALAVGRIAQGKCPRHPAGVCAGPGLPGWR